MLPILQRLTQSPLVADGALGTYLYQTGHDPRALSETLVLTDPHAVLAAHRAYLEAGAGLIETHTFGANPFALAADAPGTDCATLLDAAARLALTAADGTAYVAGAIGPILNAPDDTPAADLADAYTLQARTLADAGVHLLILETFPSLRLALPALDAALATRLPVAVQLIFSDGVEADGITAQTAATTLIDRGASIIGANCGRGLASIRSALPGLLAAARGRAHVSLFPNAGYPEQLNGRLAYLLTPDYLGLQARDWFKSGVRLIGGCCGTTPESIQAIQRAASTLRKPPAWPIADTTTRQPDDLTTPSPVATPDPCHATTSPLPSELLAPCSAFKPGLLLDALASIRLPVIAEIDPPPHLDPAPMLEGARALLDAGAHAISLADNPLASIRTDPFAIGARLHAETGAPVVCHLTGRDRNSHAVQSTLMAAHMNHIAAVLCVTGDPMVQHRGTAVYELNSSGLLRLAAKLNAGHSHTGRPLNAATAFSLGAAYNSHARNPALELQRLRQKQTHGAVFTMTQPVFDAPTARRVMDDLRATSLRVFLGFMPPLSAKLANYLHNEVPGILLPAPLLDQLNRLPDPADQQRAALDATHALLAELAPELDGVYLITPGLRYPALLPLLEQLNQLRTPK